MKTGKLKDCTDRAHDALATDLDVDVDWLIDILSHSSLTRTVPNGKT